MAQSFEVPGPVRELAARLGHSQPMRRGSLSERYVKCGKPGCACAEDAKARHGPYYSLTRAVGGQTRSRFLNPEEAQRAREQIETGQQFRRQVEAYWAAVSNGRMPSWKLGRKQGKPRLKKTALGEALAADLVAEIERLVGREAAAALDFEAVETAVRRQALRFAARVVEQRLNADHSDFTGARRSCSCGQPARYVDRRAKPFQTVLGELRLERAYYYCAACQRGFCPRDQQWGMEDTSLSPGVTRMVGTVGALTRDAVSIHIVHVDLQPTGTFNCSNPWLNRLREVLVRTHLNYNLDHPLDPIREKQGWTQDAQDMFETAAYLTDVSALYRKWWRDWADAQQADGLLGSVAPVVGQQVHDWNCPWWSGVIVLLPWQYYLYYGDRQFLEEAFEPMRRYVDYLGFLAKTGAGQRPLGYPDPRWDVDSEAARNEILIWRGAGDWLNPKASGLNDALPGAMTAMPAWSYYASMVSQTAILLGKPEDTAKYAAIAKNVADRYNAAYFHCDTGIYGDRPDQQTAMVLPLALGIVPKHKGKLVLARLIDAIHADHDHVGVGFVALPFLLETLTGARRADLANRMVNQHDYPSWATLMHDGVFSEGWHGGGAQMPSCGGAVGMWLYQLVLGIRPDPSGPGFQKFILAPQPDPPSGLTWARGSYRSVRGTIESDWKYSGGEFILRAVVPPNTTATLYLPAESVQTVTESGRPVGQSAGVRLLRTERDTAVFEVGSGTYAFRTHPISR